MLSISKKIAIICVKTNIYLISNYTKNVEDILKYSKNLNTFKRAWNIDGLRFLIRMMIPSRFTIIPRKAKESIPTPL